VQHCKGRVARGMPGDGLKVSRQQDCSSWKVIGWQDAGARSRMRDCERGCLRRVDVDERGRVGMIREWRSGDCVLNCVPYCEY